MKRPGDRAQGLRQWYKDMPRTGQHYDMAILGVALAVPLATGPGRSVVARGPASAWLMILVDCWRMVSSPLTPSGSGSRTWLSVPPQYILFQKKL